MIVVCLISVLTSALSRSASAIDLLNDNIDFSPFSLELRPYVKVPFGLKNVISMTTRSNDPRLYVTTQEGAIFVVDDDGNGNATANFFFDAVSSIFLATGRTLYGSGGHDGLQSVAFHPDFDSPASAGYGKLYTTLLESRPESTEGHHYLGDSTSGDANRDSVLVEWTYDHNFGEVDYNSYREVFRARLPVGDHMIKQAKFNPYAGPGDEDYGLLYVTHGDSSSQESVEDRPQHFDNIVGKMLRIDPLQAAAAPYSIPANNPFADSNDPSVLKEIYAYGFRNPHTFSFNPDDQGDVRLLVGDIGRANIEEVNLVENGGNYGWPKREGTFLHPQNPDNTPNSGYYEGVSAVPSNEAELNLDYTYPVAQFDHNNNFDSTPINQPYASVAIASSFVIHNGSDPNLQGQFVFTNFAGADGNVYHTDFGDMLAAKTSLESGDSPGDLTQAGLHRLFVSMDDSYYSELTHLLGAGRSDARFGEGVFGEMYISNKYNGFIYLVTNSVPLSGDYNQNHVVDAADYTVWRNMLGQVGYHLAADGTGDGKVDAADYTVWKNHFGEVWTSSGSSAGVGAVAPEPTVLTLACVVLLASCFISARRWRCPRGMIAP
jgi:hypothetical protein